MGKYPSSNDLAAVLPDLAASAQSVYDSWDQVDGFDEELGSGGICQDIASAMADVLSEAGVEEIVHFHQSVGENHVYLVALLADGVFTIDIPPHVYEDGGGYVWKKKEGVMITAEEVFIDRLGGSIDPQEFFQLYGE